MKSWSNTIYKQDILSKAGCGTNIPGLVLTADIEMSIWDWDKQKTGFKLQRVFV